MSTRLGKSPQRFHPAMIESAVVVPPTILVVDDHEDTRILLRYLMERMGRRVIEAVDGDQAVELAGRIHPDLVLMDEGLPGIDGVVAMQRIRQLPASRDVPVVFISGHAQPEVRATALALGGTEYLVKPISLDELESVVIRSLFMRVQRQ